MVTEPSVVGQQTRVARQGERAPATACRVRQWAYFLNFVRSLTMSVDLNEEVGGKLLLIKLSGKLVKEDYEQFVPEVERLIQQHGKIRVLCQMHDFHGWSLGALWEDIKFDLKHFGDIERLALVGDRKWEAGMAAFCKPFTRAAIRYFDESKGEEAVRWIKEGITQPV